MIESPLYRDTRNVPAWVQNARKLNYGESNKQHFKQWLSNSAGQQSSGYVLDPERAGLIGQNM